MSVLNLVYLENIYFKSLLSFKYFLKLGLNYFSIQLLKNVNINNFFYLGDIKLNSK